MKPVSADPILLTPQHVANRSGRSAHYIQQEIRAGRLPATVIPAGKCRRFWITEADAAAFIARQAARQTEAA
jgi:predicted site-specific integrase-resolvase